MLDSITSTFTLIADYLTDFYNIIVDWFNDVLSAHALMVLTISVIPDYFSWLPEGILSVLLTLLALVVLYKVLGRT